MQDNSVMSVPKQRSSNLELYRIVCMLLIVAHHYVVNSGLTYPDGPMMTSPTSMNTLFLWGIGMWGKTGINCFLMITGYFMCKSQITLQKFLKLMLQIYLYKIVIYVIFLCTGYEVFSVTRIMKLMMPIWGINTNFTSCFIVFWLTIPFWNILIKGMTQRQHLILLALLLGVYTLLGSYPNFIISFNYVTWFGVIYLIASYIRLYPHKILNNSWLWGWVTFLSVLLALISGWAMQVMFGNHGALTFVSESNKIFAVMIAVCSFLWVKNIHIPYSKFINAVGASTFGVLLIHANSDAMRTWLWRDTVDCVGHYSLPLGELALYTIGVVLTVFSVCVVIDYLRIQLIEKPFFKWFDKIYPKTTKL